MSPHRRFFVELAYLDESGSDKDSEILVIGALIVPEEKFTEMEVLVGAVVEELIPRDKQESFERFHAYELYNGHGVFSDLPETSRFDAISKLLGIVSTGVGGLSLPFIYSAINKKALEKSLFHSAKPTDVAFSVCTLGIERWLEQNCPDRYLCLVIFDDSDDRVLKKDMQTSFRTLRQKLGPPMWSANKLWRMHDAMYFGSSKDSAGLQIADLCAYFVRRKIAGQTDPRDFFSLIANQVTCAAIEPEWSQYPAIFVDKLNAPL